LALDITDRPQKKTTEKVFLDNGSSCWMIAKTRHMLITFLTKKLVFFRHFLQVAVAAATGAKSKPE
jgi:hypothetical protein